MFNEISPNTQAILLLTAPLITGKGNETAETLKPGEYKRLAKGLRERSATPADLMGTDASAVLDDLGAGIPKDRILRLMNRGFQLSQAVERWSARAIWVISRADSTYPSRWKRRLKEDAPAVLYGVGKQPLLESGGLAVVGSRNAGDLVIRHAKSTGSMAAQAGVTIVSGGARGVDQAAMSGALEGGGCAVGILADNLERAAIERSNRDFLITGRLVLASPYDPTARFLVGHAMQRNKLVYGLSELALVEDSDLERGGTWTGAVEQLDHLRMVPIFTRGGLARSRGLEALERRGARQWPEPVTVDGFLALINSTPESPLAPVTLDLAFETNDQAIIQKPLTEQVARPNDHTDGARKAAMKNVAASVVTPTENLGPQVTESNPFARELLSFVSTLLSKFEQPMTEAEIAQMLDVTPKQAKAWLARLVEQGTLVRKGKPARFAPAETVLPLL
jgi:DNA processing protein